MAAALIGTALSRAQLPEGKLALGANANENFQWATPEILERTQTKWVRGFFPASEFISGKRSFVSDSGIKALNAAAESGHRIILSIKWDSKDGGFGPMPKPGSQEEKVALQFVDRLLDATQGHLSALVVINELLIDTRERDLVPEADGRIPALVFLRRVVEQIHAEHRKAAGGGDLPLFAGGMTRLDLPATQRSVATQRMIRWIDNDPKLAGADFHLHEPSREATKQALEFVRRAVPNKVLMTTEFSLVLQWKAHLGDRLDNSQSGREFCNRYRLPSGMRVAEFLSQVFASPVPVGEWHEFLASQPWFEGHYLAQMTPLLQTQGIKIATYALTWNPKPAAHLRRISEETTPWFLNPLFVPGMAYVPDSARLPENYELFEDFVTYQDKLR